MRRYSKPELIRARTAHAGLPQRRSATVGGRATAHPSEQAEAGGVKRIVRWTFYAFVFSLSFETVNLGIPVEPTSIIGGLLVMITLAQPRVFFQRPPVAFLFFILYLCVCATMILLLGDPHKDEVIRYLFVFSQLIVLCWISYSLMRHSELAKTALITLAASCVILAILQLTGIATRTPEFVTKLQRATAFGFHPNNVARIYALGLIVLVGFFYGLYRNVLRPRFLVWPSSALIGIAIVQTGSRGGLLALGGGLLVFALTGKNIGIRIRNVVVVLAGLGFFIFLTFQVETTKLRFEKAIEQGELARREKIYPTAWQMFLEKPLLGWGPITSSYELGARLRHPREASKNSHNFVLEILVVTGLAGAALMFTGTGMAVLAAWKARRNVHAILPFALLVTVLAANMSGLWHFNKLHWIVIAYALASAGHRAVGSAQRKVTRPIFASPQLHPSAVGSSR